MFSVPWSIGGVVDTDGHVKFDQFFRKILVGKSEENPIPASAEKILVPFPDTGSVYDYCCQVFC